MQLRIKRALDILLSAILIVLSSPVWITASLAIALMSGMPILFKQLRPGLNGSPFYVLKFRTMTAAVDSNGDLLPVDQRITAVGRWLRRLSIDEIPQLLNVLRGEMSLVGPRPLLIEYLDRYTPDQMRRHEMRPGITGLAQISGRQHLPFSRRIELDVYYVDNWSLWLDLRILLGTIRRLFGLKEVDPVGKYEMIDDLANKPE